MSAFKRLLWFLLLPPQILAYARDTQDLKIHHPRWMTALAASPLVPVRVAMSASYWRLLLHALSFIPTHLPTRRTSSEPRYYGATLPHQFSWVEVRLVLPSPQHGVWWCKATRTDNTLAQSGYQECLQVAALVAVHHPPSPRMCAASKSAGNGKLPGARRHAPILRSAGMGLCWCCLFCALPHVTLLLKCRAGGSVLVPTPPLCLDILDFLIPTLAHDFIQMLQRRGLATHALALVDPKRPIDSFPRSTATLDMSSSHT
ncbi:hypothetical protein B0H14DRAFT_3510100 [Mycena olivaceomarginata]|nr:hypothetical protein B0H14DRAFT_3510100 [Mycena olivaceomarginata]